MNENDLILELLLDFGNVCISIAKSLLNIDYSTFDHLLKSTRLDKNYLRDGLSFLIQKRFVSFVNYNSVINYSINPSFIKKRLYYPLYLNYVHNKLNKKTYKVFLELLLLGTYKYNFNIDQSTFLDQNKDIIDFLLINNFLIDDYKVKNNKSIKLNFKLIFINFDYLDKKIMEIEFFNLINKKFDKNCANLYFSLIKLDENFSKPGFIDVINLEKIKNTFFNDFKDVNKNIDINNYLIYLLNSNFFKEGLSHNKKYEINFNKNILKKYKVSGLISNKACKRVFNMIFKHKSLNDQTLTSDSLLSLGLSKNSIFKLEKEGLIIQRCENLNKALNRMEYFFEIDFNYLSVNILYKIEKKILFLLKKYNKEWDYSFYNEMCKNDNVWISDILSLSIDHLIFSN